MTGLLWSAAPAAALQWRMRPAVMLLLLALSTTNVQAAQCPARGASAAGLARLRSAMAQGRFVAYEPSALTVTDGRVHPADAPSVREDLALLRRRFDALITYDATHGGENVPPIAAGLGFRALIIGVWDPTDEQQLRAALAAAQDYPRLVVGLSLGNELLFSGRSTAARLAGLVAAVRRRAPEVPLATTEPFHLYYQPETAALREQLDFTLVNVHPIFQPWFRDAPASAAAQFVSNVLGRLAPLACGPLLVKETGVPTAPTSAGFSETRQADFYRELRRLLSPSAQRGFAYFSAFDAPWRAADATPGPGPHPEEAHWGLYDAQRLPKQAARELPPLPRRQSSLHGE
jgi:exo-beta-1,3-glucanase (GH17 family)